MAKAPRTHLTKAEADEFDAITPLLKQMHKDFQDLSKKKPDGGVSTVRIGMINRLLSRAKEALRREPSFGLLDLLDQELVPQNADALIVLGQYVAALVAATDKYKWTDIGGDRVWRIQG